MQDLKTHIFVAKCLVTLLVLFYPFETYTALLYALLAFQLGQLPQLPGLLEGLVLVYLLVKLRALAKTD